MKNNLKICECGHDKTWHDDGFCQICNAGCIFKLSKKQTDERIKELKKKTNKPKEKNER